MSPPPYSQSFILYLKFAPHYQYTFSLYTVRGSAPKRNADFLLFSPFIFCCQRVDLLFHADVSCSTPFYGNANANDKAKI